MSHFLTYAQNLTFPAGYFPNLSETQDHTQAMKEVDGSIWEAIMKEGEERQNSFCLFPYLC